MCGIAGYVSLTSEPPDEILVRRMADTLSHRGPDEEGVWTGTRAAFGHRRLSILDPERGQQPMRSASGAACVVHNGQVYNTPELRGDLLSHGPGLRTHCDTEAIVEGLERHGEAYLDRLNGIFAFGWHHEPSGVTLVARDPFGVKPLYYHRNERRLLFASEIRTILADPTVKPELDPDELGALLALRYSPAPGTLFRGVRKVLPGHFLRIEGDRVEEIAYDTFVPGTPDPRGFDECVDAYAAELDRTVRRQMLSDVPVGAFLSGGLDSGAVARIMGEQAPGFPAYTVGFEDPGGPVAMDEREPARDMAKRFGAEFAALAVTPEAFRETLPEVVRSMEEPVGSASAVPFWHLSRRAARNGKVVLTGQGADEPHGGYPRYQGVLLAEQWGRFLPPGFGPGLAALMRGRRERLRRGLSILGERDAQRLLLRTYRHFDETWVRRLVRPEWRAQHDLADERVAFWRQRVDHLDPLGQMLYVDARLWLADDLLLYGDKLSMAHGLEVRVPYLDRDLMRFVESLPVAHRVRRGEPKRLHKAALARMLPGDVVRRPKLGFETPVDRWFRTLWVPQLPEWLWGSQSFLPSVLEVDAVRDMVAEHREGRADHSKRLYTLLALEFWGRSFL